MNVDSRYQNNHDKINLFFSKQQVPQNLSELGSLFLEIKKGFNVDSNVNLSEDTLTFLFKKIEKVKEKVKVWNLTDQEEKLLCRFIYKLDLKEEDELSDRQLGFILCLIRFEELTSLINNSKINELFWEDSLIESCQEKINEWLSDHSSLKVDNFTINLCQTYKSLSPMFNDIELIKYLDEMDWGFYLFLIISGLCFIVMSVLTYLYSEAQLVFTAKWRYELILFNLLRVSLIFLTLNLIVICLS